MSLTNDEKEAFRAIIRLAVLEAVQPLADRITVLETNAKADGRIWRYLATLALAAASALITYMLAR